MSDSQLFQPPAEFPQRAHVSSTEDYDKRYAESISDPAGFWQKVSERLTWQKKPTQIMNCDLGRGDISWFEDGQLNVTVNCLDRHVEAGLGDRTAIIWESDDPSVDLKISYTELLKRVCRCANLLKHHGVKKGDRVCIYLPMIPELAVVMLACARIGAVHSIVFGGFSATSLRNRIEDSNCKMVVTADEGLRGGKIIPLKQTTDQAIEGLDFVECVLVVKRSGGGPGLRDGRDYDFASELSAASIADTCPPEVMNAEDPLFILYTSGSTGKPKGVLHTTAGYLTYVSYTHELIFDHRAGEDIYWCTADIGWVTGHSYIIYGPLCNGATTLMFEGIPTFPDVGRFWDVVDKHQVTLFYTAPTAIRALQRYGDDPVTSRSRSSLRLLGTVGEPINPEAWLWYHEVVGQGRCPIVDTWWQTETGGIMISPLPGATPTKPGSATKPFFGVQLALVNDQGEIIEGNGVSGNLCITEPWPGMMRTIYGDHQRFIDTYFKAYPGKYFTGDGCRRDEDGYYWITGRVDDVLNVSGHRLGTAEVEAALGHHPAVAESAVVGYPHDIKGQGIYAFVTLNADVVIEEGLKKELVKTVRTVIGPIASPDQIQFSDGLPKTRSGKIMRRILRNIASGDVEDLGDTSTLADPSVVPTLVKGRVL